MSFAYYIAAILIALAIAYKFKSYLRSWYKKAFAHFMYSFVAEFNKLAGAYKLDVFAILHDAKPENGLEVLEIGAGTGANFAFLPSGCHLTCVEPNGHMHGLLRKTYENYKNVFTLKQIVNGSAEDMPGVPDASMDVVISTLVLCSVSDVRKCIAEVRRVLKPGGHFCYFEHTVDSNKNTWTHTIQRLVNPVWRIAFDNCHTLRDPQPIIDDAGFSDVIYKTAYMDTVPKPICHVTYGVTTK